MSTRSGRVRQSVIETSPPRTRKGVSPTRSPARRQKSSPTRVSTRSSPSRKSPSRKTSSKYPAPKSPSRTARDEKSEKEKSFPKSPAKRPSLKKDIQVKSDDISSKLDSFRSTRSRALEYTLQNVPSIFATESLLEEKRNGFETSTSVSDLYSFRNRKIFEDIAPRRSSRLRDVTDSATDIRQSASRSVSKSISKSVSKSLDTFSDDENSDDVLERKSQSVTRKLSTPLPSNVVYRTYKFEFGGGIGAYFLIFMIPIAIFSILVACLKSCSHKSLLEYSMLKSVSFWFDMKSSIFVLNQYAIQALLMLLPVWGTKDTSKDGRKYYFNAFFCCLTNYLMFSALEYYKILNSDVILESTVRLAVLSYLLAVSLATLLYMKSKKVNETEINPYGNSGLIFYDFFVGREIQPHLMRMNIKIWISRISNITTLILSILLFRKGLILQENIESISLEEISKIHNKFVFKPTLLVYSLMQITYAVYFIIKDYKITSTFYWQYEGMGYLQLISSATYPYFFTTISKYVADIELELTNNVLVAASVLYGAGFLIMLISNDIKYEFRKNPLHPSLTRLESMPTFHGKKLLISNIWGFVRHPNYFGDILIHIALALPGILTHQVMAAAPALITILVLVHRAWRDHGRCKRRYGAAWQRYCKRVPSVLIPKII